MSQRAVFMLPEKGVPSAVLGTVRRWCQDYAAGLEESSTPQARSRGCKSSVAITQITAECSRFTIDYLAPTSLWIAWLIYRAEQIGKELKQTSLCSAFYGGSKRDTARICWWASCRGGAVAAERRRLLSMDISCPRGAQQQTRGTPLTDRGTLDRYIDPAPHTMRTVSKMKIWFELKLRTDVFTGKHLLDVALTKYHRELYKQPKYVYMNP